MLAVKKKEEKFGICSSKRRLIILLEAKDLCTLAEAPAANVKAVGADYTSPLSTDAAASLWGTLSILAGVLWNKVDWHAKDRPKPYNRFDI